MSDDFLERTKRRRRKLNEQINQSFVNDDGEQIGEKQADEDKENVNTETVQDDSTSEHVKKKDDNTISSVITRKHRLKSQELLKNIENEDPNEVMKEIHEAKDLISEKIKNIKTDDETDDAGKRDTRLDLGPDIDRAGSTISESTRSRLQRIKERAEETIREEHEETERSYRLKGSFRRRDQQTRFDEDTVTEAKSDAESIDRSLTARGRFKKAVETVAKEFHEPTRDEQFDFFCKQWAEEKEEPKPKAKIEKKTDKPDEIKPAQGGDAISSVAALAEATAELGTTATIVAMPEETAPLLGETDDWKHVCYVKAEYKPHQKQKEDETKLYFIPNANPIALNQKLSNERSNPRYLEREGYYVGSKPFVTNQNRFLFEDRLIHMPDKLGFKWFGLDGQIIALPDPIKYVATRPSLALTMDPATETQYKQALYTEFDGNKISDGIDNFRIDIDINRIEFNYHHLFSQEHVLAFRLVSMCKHFSLIEEQNLIKILTEKLKALKVAESHLSNEIANNTNRTTVLDTSRNAQRFKQAKSSSEANDMKKLMAYKYEIQKTRQERNKEMRMHKQLVEKIINTWREIKDLRQAQQYRNTDVKLIIKKKDTDKKQDEKEMREEIEEAYQESKSLKMEEYEKALAEYNSKFKIWKHQRTKKKEAQKRQSARQEKTEDKDKNKKLIDEMEERDLQILQETELIKPEKPTDFDERLLRQKIESEYQTIFREPGYPIFSFEIIHESNVSPPEQCSALEKIRRETLSRTRVYVKILFNNKVVHKTTKLPLKADFTVEWGQIFNIYMIYWPESIRLQIFEFCEQTGPLKRRSNESMIAEIILPVPEANCTCNNYDLEKYEFASQNEYYMRTQANQITSFQQSGLLYAGAGWGIDKDSKVLMPPNAQNSNNLMKTLQNYDAVAALGVARMQDTNQLAKWIFKSNLDPNDPRNADLINLIQAVSGSDNFNSLDGLTVPEYFRLDQFIRPFYFVKDDEVFFSSKRFKLIELRAKEEPEFKSYKMIPSLDRFIGRDVFESYEKRKKSENHVSEGKEENEIEAARLAGRRLLQKVRENILRRFRYAQHQKTLADMIVEETIPNLTALGHLFWSLYVEPRRPLYPVRKERKKITGQSVIAEDVHILINIASAYDLPIRKDKMSNDPIKVVKDSTTNKTVKLHERIAGESLINPYVEVTFQRNCYRTTTGDGPNASWNQELRLPFKAPNNDFTPSSLQTCPDVIYFNIYDEVEIDILEDDRDRDHVVHKQIQRNWLGSLKIPFSALYFNSRIDGTFKLESPPILLGYTRDTRLSRVQTTSVVENPGLIFEQPTRESSYLSLFLTIEPQLMAPEALNQTYDSSENQELLEKGVIWSERLLSRYQNREFRTTVMDINGRSVFITRYFRGIKPPEELSENGDSSFETAQNVARFVSLIPFLSDTLVFPGLCDIWSTCDQFMQMLSGDEEEHAVLLTNFFLGLGKKAWLLLGNSAVYGTSAFCLSYDNNEYIVWYQGKPYKVNEPYNPVRVVSALVNSDNIWANIQQFDEPYRIDFDVSKRKCWQPFFTNDFPNVLDSIQPEKLEYFATDAKFIRELETKIETKLREKIQEWRPHYITRWNRYACTALRQILQRMEKSRDDPINSEPNELAQTLNSYRMSGFPINLSYTNTTAIFDAVYAANVHTLPTSDVEFALAVHIYPYPNTILSVWVYVASLVRKK